MTEASRTVPRDQKTIDQIHTFNLDCHAHAGTAAESAGQARQLLAELARETAFRATAYARTMFAADALSRDVFKASWRRFAKGALLIAVLAVIAFEVFAHLYPHWVALLVYTVGLGALALWHRHHQRARTEERFLVYRSFAEALRVQVAWLGAGLVENVDEYYERLHRNEVEWVRQAMKGLRVASMPAHIGSDPVAGVGWAIRSWVSKQREWLNANTEHLNRLGERTERIAHWGKWLGFATAAALLPCMFLLIQPESHGDRAHEGYTAHAVHMAGVTLIAIMLAAAGFAHTWGRIMAYAITGRRYEEAARLHERAMKLLHAAMSTDNPDLTRAHGILRALGQAALIENTAWLRQHREQPLDITGH